jgi:putative molybdopterin biosynthesis protein
MSEEHLYQAIAEHVRQDILAGKFKPGDKLPTIRQLTAIWNCTSGTVQRAYQALAKEGLVSSRVGQGTQVLAPAADWVGIHPAVRQARLVHRAESFILESISAGYALAEIERSLTFALDHWRQAVQNSQQAPQNTLRFAGSHDLLISWLAVHMSDILPGWRLDVNFSGSLDGLIALSSENAEMAGCHLWDTESADYNSAYVYRLMPGRRVALITLAQRSQGLILAPGNPHHIRNLADLASGDIRFVNRQAGSGTRLWLDQALQARHIDPGQISGYDNALVTHSEVARRVAEGLADVGLGFEGAARAFNLDFIPLTHECYELATLEKNFTHPAIQALVNWLASPDGKERIAGLAGYGTETSGRVRWIG